MIDIHCHLLPGIDDGSKGLGTSLDLAEAAVSDGITHAILTPHHMNGQYLNHAQDVLSEATRFQQTLDDANINLKVYPAQEVRITGDLVNALDQGDLLSLDGQGQYMLIEFPSREVPLFTFDMLFNLKQRGVVPIIAHPERNEAMMDDPSLLYRMVSEGAFAQVTASSYVGTFGKKVRRFSEDIIEHGLAHVLASDAHYLPGRSYEMRAAFDKLNSEHGSELADLFEENAKAIINGTPVHSLRTTPIKKRRFLDPY